MIIEQRESITRRTVGKKLRRHWTVGHLAETTRTVNEHIFFLQASLHRTLRFVF